MAGGLIAACGGAAAPAAKATAAIASASAKAVATATPTPTKETIGYVSVSAANSVVWSAYDGGFFTKYGIEATLDGIADSTQAVAALLSGQVPINCGLSGTAVVGADLKGNADLTVIATSVGTFPNSLYVQPSVTSVAQLRGKKVGVTRLGTASDTAAQIALKSGGLTQKDVQWIQTGGLNQTVAALKAGQIEAGSLSPPETLIARNLGMKELVDVGSLGVEYVYNGVIISRAFGEKNHDLILNVLRALLEGEHRFRTDATFGKQVITTHTKLKDPAQLEETYSDFAKKYLAWPPFPTQKALQTVIDQLAVLRPEAKGADPKKFYDDSYLNTLKASGFISKLGG
ncbi:MAG: ABC transporter substrate-binding protein [Chloroflexota bacterium]|nr:ABC transporter substrate-binding protein [Chloroflexota bacterium]